VSVLFLGLDCHLFGFRKHFDEDVRDTVKVKFIHGFWKNEDANRIALLVSTFTTERIHCTDVDYEQEQGERYPNISLISAYIPDPFGTARNVPLRTACETHTDFVHLPPASFEDARPIPPRRHGTSHHTYSCKWHLWQACVTSTDLCRTRT